MTIPIYYRNKGENILTSYDYVDIASGTGVTSFYLYTAFSGAIAYKLGTSQVYSDTIEEAQSNTAATTFTKLKDLDFDLSAFQVPRTIRGTALLNITQDIDGTQSADSQTYIIAKLRKWDGTTETEIASGQGSTTTKTGASPESKTVCIYFEVPKTQFKKNETMRLTIEQWAKTEAAGSQDVTFAHDPRNRDGTEITPSTDTDVTSIARFYVPFEIQT